MDNFIKTSDKETAERLKSEGLELFDEKNGIFTFLATDKKINFDKNDKIVFSNKIEL